MTKPDYLAQVDALRAPPALRARIEALPRPAKKRRPVGRWVGLCACLAAVLLGIEAGSRLIPLGGSSSNDGPGTGSGGHEDGSSIFMSYAGPVFPLTTVGEAPGLSAERSITLDFAPWIPVWWSNEEEANSRTNLTEEERQDVLDSYNNWYPDGGRYQSSSDILVTDAYVLTNNTDAEQTVTLLYPFAGALYTLNRQMPVLTVNGQEITPTLHAGGYSGGFEGAWGSEDSGEQLNLAQLDSWEQYKTLLSDGSYLAQALDGAPDLSDTPVIVYEFANYSGPAPDDEAGIPNPSIRASFNLDYDNTTVLSYGFHGMSRNREAGTMIQEFSIPQPFYPQFGEPYYLIVVGDDIQNLTVGGYVTGGTDSDTKPLPGCSVDVARYETDLESALRTATELMFATWQANREGVDGIEFELFFGLMKEFLCSYSVLSEHGAARYSTGWLWELDFMSVNRVFYLEAEVSIPAGDSAAVEASFAKAASYDFYCAHTENKDIRGYDLVTQLGTALDFTAQTAAIQNAECIEIARQNFGFDLENSITQVVLDPAVEHYYLEVRRNGNP